MRILRGEVGGGWNREPSCAFHFGFCGWLISALRKD